MIWLMDYLLYPLVTSSVRSSTNSSNLTKPGSGSSNSSKNSSWNTRPTRTMFTVKLNSTANLLNNPDRQRRDVYRHLWCLIPVPEYISEQLTHSAREQEELTCGNAFTGNAGRSPARRGDYRPSQARTRKAVFPSYGLDQVDVSPESIPHHYRLKIPVFSGLPLLSAWDL